MKRAVATSRCEVGGKVYLPGDDMTVTDEQFAALKGYNAVTEIVLRAASPVILPSDTIADIDAKFARKMGTFGRSFGVGKPKKE